MTDIDLVQWRNATLANVIHIGVWLNRANVLRDHPEQAEFAAEGLAPVRLLRTFDNGREVPSELAGHIVWVPLVDITLT